VWVVPLAGLLSVVAVVVGVVAVTAVLFGASPTRIDVFRRR